MQEFQGNRLKKTQLLDDGPPPMEEESTHQVIGKLPKKGQQIQVNGLLFDVIHADLIRGIFHARIAKPGK